MCWRGLDEMEEFENPFRPLPVEICHKGDPPARTFRVKLRRRQDGFGLNFDATDSAVLLVGWVPDGGAASQWNQKAQQKIQPYDRLLEVNGSKLFDSAKMLKAVSAADGLVEFCFERPRPQEFTVHPRGEKLGVILKFSKVVPSLIVKALDTSGVLVKTNVADAAVHLKPHDRIVQVNGESGDCIAMTRQLLEETVTLKCWQYST
ncbi:RPA1 [Symbiodinium natans]|uniref:RPA1 protein n=1 Tax=Symbiodinium natans TaxID=878477 RepID=A0A812QN43_9DINO|nr:RPA1 [Symbiodinium natans]